MTEFGKMLKHLCIDANTNQSKLAESIGCSISHVSDIINGKRKPKPLFVLETTRYFKRLGVRVPDDYATLAGIAVDYMYVGNIGDKQRQLLRMLVEADLPDYAVDHLIEQLESTTKNHKFGEK